MKVGARLVKRGDRVALRHRAVTQPRDLGEHEPHPVTGLSSRAQLDDGRARRRPAGRTRSARGRADRSALATAAALRRRHRRRHLPPLEVLWRHAVVVLTGGVVKVCVAVAVVTAVLVTAAGRRAARGCRGVRRGRLRLQRRNGRRAAPGRATEACPPPAESLAASDPACAGRRGRLHRASDPEARRDRDHDQCTQQPPSPLHVPTVPSPGSNGDRSGRAREPVACAAGPVAQSVRAADS